MKIQSPAANGITGPVGDRPSGAVHSTLRDFRRLDTRRENTEAPSEEPVRQTTRYASGRSTSRSLQIFLARSWLISLWRGTVEALLELRLMYKV